MRDKNGVAVAELVAFMKSEIKRDDSILDALLTRLVELMPVAEYVEHLEVMRGKQ